MPRYHINGVWHYSDTDLSPADLDSLSKEDKPAVKPVEAKSKTVKGDLNSTWRNAETIGPPKVGEHYVDDDRNMSLMDRLRKLTVGDARPRTVQKLDPFGTEAALQGKGPTPVFAAAEEFKNVANPIMEHLASKAKPRLGLPPAPESVTNPKRTFYQGPAGTTEAGKTYPIDTAPASPRLGQTTQQVNKGELPVTVLPREVEGVNQLDPITAANRGTKLGDIQSIDTSSVSGNLQSLEKAKTEPIQLPKKPVQDIGNIGDPSLPYQLDSAPVQAKTKPQGFDATKGVSGSTTGPSKLKSTGLAESYSNTTPSRTSSVKDVVKQWADGNRGATYRGNLAAEKFAHLNDPALIDRFEAGDRSGGLKELEAYFEAKHKQGVEAGLFKEDQKVLNYIRHEYDNSEEEIRAAMKQFVPETSSIAKTRKTATYLEGEAKGLTRKYQTIPELVNAYETKFNKALKNKEFYNYLKSTDQVSGLVSDKPENWTFKGPNAEELKTLVSNVLGKSPEGLKLAGDAASVTKNISLSGGIPYTKYNMHQWNIAKNDIALNGYWSGLKKLFSDPTGKKSVEWMKNLPDAEKQTLADLVDKGWQGHPMADTGKEVNFFSKLTGKTGDSTIGKGTGRVLDAAGKVLDLGQHAFEDPLFKRSLPALTAQRTLEAFHRLEGQMGREQALKAAAQIGNDFYGGVDTVLRNPVNKDLHRIAFLAPNWMESQLTKATRMWSGLGKTVAGTGNAVDKTYAKALGRSATLPSIGAITGGAVLSSRGSDIGAIHMGSDAKDKNREFPTLTTANEEMRIPITAPIQMYMGNPGALKDLLIKNRISTPAKTFMNLVKGQDDFGSPLAGKDKYNQPISFGKGLANYAAEASRPFQHQAVQALVGYLQGKMSKEEAISRGLELPLNYTRKN